MFSGEHSFILIQCDLLRNNADGGSWLAGCHQHYILAVHISVCLAANFAQAYLRKLAHTNFGEIAICGAMSESDVGDFDSLFNSPPAVKRQRLWSAPGSPGNSTTGTELSASWAVPENPGSAPLAEELIASMQSIGKAYGVDPRLAKDGIPHEKSASPIHLI